MKRSLPENIMLTISLLLVVMIMMLFVAPIAYATGDRGNSDDINVDVNSDISTGSVDVATGDVNVSTGGNTSRSLALGNVLGDVDIAACLGSTQWSTPVYGKQKLVVNWVCVAEFYLRYQQPGLAAMALCNTEILKEFDTEEECEQAHSFLALAVEPEPVAENFADNEDEFHDEQQQINMTLQSEIEQLRELYERRPTPAVTRQVVREPFLSEEKKAKLREVVK